MKKFILTMLFVSSFALETLFALTWKGADVDKDRFATFLQNNAINWISYQNLNQNEADSFKRELSILCNGIRSGRAYINNNVWVRGDLSIIPGGGRGFNPQKSAEAFALQSLDYWVKHQQSTQNGNSLQQSVGSQWESLGQVQAQDVLGNGPINVSLYVRILGNNTFYKVLYKGKEYRITLGNYNYFSESFNGMFIIDGYKYYLNI